MSIVDLSPPTSLPAAKFTPIKGFELRFDLTPSDLENVCEEVITRSKKVFDSIACLPSNKCTFDSVFKPLGLLEGWVHTYSSCVTMPQHVHTDKALRETSSKLEQKLSEFEIESSMRIDLYQAAKNAAKNIDLDTLDEEDKRLINKVILEFKRKGLDLEESKREELKSILNRLSELSILFSKTIAEDETTVLLTEEELDGLDKEFIKNLKSQEKDGKTYKVLTMKYPDVIPTLENASHSSTRQRVEYAFHARCTKNVDVLQEAINLRLKAANLLGYKNHAQFKMELKMAKEPQAVNKFLEELKDKLSVYGKAELPTLLKMKKSVEPEATELFSYDVNYSKNQLLVNHFNVDHQKIKSYYPLDSVTQKMLNIYQKVLNLTFSEVEDPQSWNQETPKEIKIIKVQDKHTCELLGYFYLDLFPRPGKYTHAACFPIQPGYIKPNGERQVPIAAMVANFSKSSDTIPALLRHSELTTYFHELGHVMHHICSATKYARFHGTNVEGDFVEAPSQMLENWCWDSNVLNYLSEHYQTQKPIPEELIKSLIDSKNVGSGLHYLRQLLFAIYDLKIHSIEKEQKLDLNELFLNLRKEITLIPGQPNTTFVATFGHLMGGYDSGYYGYLWSEVFSADMFQTKFKNLNDITADEAGADYRKFILKPGGSKDADILLKNFLGREPNNKAFLESIQPPKLP